jgi:hypothetical protein
MRCITFAMAVWMSSIWISGTLAQRRVWSRVLLDLFALRIRSCSYSGGGGGGEGEGKAGKRETSREKLDQV